MPFICVVPGCRNCQSNSGLENFSFHRFPTDLPLREAWIKSIKREEGWKPTEHSRVCSSHFEESCFQEGLAEKSLHSHAVPTIFVNRPSSSNIKLKQRKHVTKYLNVPEFADANEPTMLRNLLSKRSRGCQTESVEGSIKELKKMEKLLNRYKLIAARRRAKVVTMATRYSRLEEKKRGLEAIIETLCKDQDSLKDTVQYNDLSMETEVLTQEELSKRKESFNISDGRSKKAEIKKHQNMNVMKLKRNISRSDLKKTQGISEEKADKIQIVTYVNNGGRVLELSPLVTGRIAPPSIKASETPAPLGSSIPRKVCAPSSVDTRQTVAAPIGFSYSVPRKAGQSNRRVLKIKSRS